MRKDYKHRVLVNLKSGRIVCLDYDDGMVRDSVLEYLASDEDAYRLLDDRSEYIIYREDIEFVKAVDNS